MIFTKQGIRKSLHTRKLMVSGLRSEDNVLDAIIYGPLRGDNSEGLMAKTTVIRITHGDYNFGKFPT
jgi:hypothetical protein